jgi:Protein of unknown function (DUF4012)
MARQRIRVEGRDALVVAGIALVAGVLATAAGPSPTGSTVFDAIVVTLAGGAAVWAAASAPWWTGVAAAGVAAAFAPEWWLLAIAAVAGLGGLWIGLQRRSLPWSRALVAGTALQVLSRLGDVERFGFTSVIAIVVMLVLAILGIRRRPRRHRRLMWIVLAGLAGGAVLGTLGFGVAALQARSDLEEGNRVARAAIDQLGAGNFNEAQAGFTQASELFGSADDALSRPWGQLARLVPVVAQHRNSAVALTHGGSEVSSTIANVLSVVDYDALRVVNGRIDLNAVAVLDQPLNDLAAALTELEDTVIEARSPWLVDALSTRLDDLLVDVSEQQDKADNAMTAVNAAPAMLGADGARVYFIAFTTPVEVRGLGGFMGNWAEVTITDGDLEVTDFGRTLDLNSGGSATKRLDGISQEYADRYGDFLLTNNDDRVAGPNVWSNITGSPHFPSVAATIAELYPQSGGKTLDGVFVMDVYAIAKLMEITGPVPIDDQGTTIDSTNAAGYLLETQYELADNAERIDLLEEVALTTVQRLLTSSLPAPPELGRMFGPLAREGRLAGWAVRPEEQDVFQRVNMAGLLPDRDGGDGVLVTFNNAAGNKIDNFLDGEVAYDVIVDRDADVVTGAITLTIRNSAPTSGLPDSVIGSQIGLPVGTNRTILTVYTGLPVIGYAVGEEPGEFEVGTENGYFTSTTFLDLAPGSETTVVVYVEGAIPDDVPYRVTVTNSPLVRPMPTTVSVNGTPLRETAWASAGSTRLP